MSRSCCVSRVVHVHVSQAPYALLHADGHGHTDLCQDHQPSVIESEDLMPYSTYVDPCSGLSRLATSMHHCGAVRPWEVSM